MADRPEIDQSFYQHLTAEDELGVVVRAHIHIEASLNQFVEARTPFPDQLPRLQFEARLRLACALGLKEDHFDALKLLGDIRNIFSHRLDATLTDAKINELFSKLPPETQKMTLHAYDITNAKREIKGPPKFSALSPKDRFVLIAVMLRGSLLLPRTKLRGTVTAPNNTPHPDARASAVHCLSPAARAGGRER